MDVTRFLNKGIQEPLNHIFQQHKNRKRLLLVKSGNGFQAEHVETAFQNAQHEDCLILDGFSENPCCEEIIRSLKLINEFSPDIVMGVGGGKIIDIAKVLRLFVNVPFCKSFEGVFPAIIKGQAPAPAHADLVPLILLPTTAGSGAEETSFAVVYVDEEKYSFDLKDTRADYLVLDRNLVRKAPMSVRASSAFDALTQCTESIWSAGATNESTLFAEKGLNLLWQNLELAVLNQEPEALEKVIIGSNFSGRAINISKTTAVHALSYKITTEYGIPHGRCVGMLLPEFLQLHERLIGKGRDGLALLQKAHAKILSIVGFSDMPSFISAYYELMRNVGFPTFKELNCQEHFNGKLILDSVNMERLSNHPLNLRREDLESIFLH